MDLSSYVAGEWVAGQDGGEEIRDAVDHSLLGVASSAGVDYARALDHGRRRGGPAMAGMSFHERGRRLKALGQLLMERKESYYELSACTGATRADSWIDIEGGIGALLSYASIGRREFADEAFHVDGPPASLSRNGRFIGRHILSPKPGVAVHINAYNFPCWGMLEKIAPSLLAGMPVLVKPANPTAYLCRAMAKDIIESGLLPEGALQLVCGDGVGLLDHVEEHDVVSFTGSAETGQQLRRRPAVIANSVPFNMEADSLNCAILGQTVAPDSEEFSLFVDEVVNEVVTKAGQKCTAIRRALVPSSCVDAVAKALGERLGSVAVGNPRRRETRMGALVSLAQRERMSAQLDRLRAGCELIAGGGLDGFEPLDADAERGAFFPPTALLCSDAHRNAAVHEVEAFGPVTTLMGYRDLDDALAIARLGRGSLVATVVTRDEGEAVRAALGLAPHHGRVLVLNRDCAKESTGHGSPMPSLVHGGPGRAGGGEELGGARSVARCMQRTAIQGAPSTLTAVCREHHDGSPFHEGGAHPFRKTYDALRIGDSLLTHRRTVTEADIVNFGCVSGDHFYAHFDQLAAADSMFGRRVAHGYFLLSAAAGMFVDPAPGPMLANYGLENLRFVEPVGIGDTIQARLTVKRKTPRDKRPDDPFATGVVAWQVEIRNQDDKPVALYEILTMVRRDAG